MRYDSEGDSLAFELGAPSFGNDYAFPQEIQPGADNQFSVNATTGDISWDAPQKSGDYLVLLKMTEFRNQVSISEADYLMTIQVRESGFVLFSNPTLDDLYLEFQNVDSADLEFSIYNSIGQFVMSGKGRFDLSGYVIDVQDLPHGAYFLKMESLGQKWIRKFIKQ